MQGWAQSFVREWGSFHPLNAGLCLNEGVNEHAAMRGPPCGPGSESGVTHKRFPGSPDIYFKSLEQRSPLIPGAPPPREAGSAGAQAACARVCRGFITYHSEWYCVLRVCGRGADSLREDARVGAWVGVLKQAEE